MRGATRVRALVWGGALVLLLGACGPGPWSFDHVEARYPELAQLPGSRLGEVRPYFLPARGTLSYFLCRWPDDAVIPVSLPPDASFDEQKDIEVALKAWEGAGLGVRFDIGGAGRGIEVRYAKERARDGARPRAATALADCAVAPQAMADPMGEVLPARIVFASIHLTRAGTDMIGREVAWSRSEKVGALLHEIGHALGFQGHATRGETVMVASVEDVKRAGKRAVAREPFRDETLRALYSVPSGTVLGRVALQPRQTQPADVMGELAPGQGLLGPYVQVGDLSGRMLWRAESGVSYALNVYDVVKLLKRPRSFVLYPEPRAADLIRSRR